MRRWLLFLCLVAFSFGWTIPVYFGIEFLLRWCELEAAPAVYQLERNAGSFPYLAEAEKFWQIGMIWLGAVVLFWSVVGACRLTFGRAPT